jgi:hypothetical protein
MNAYPDDMMCNALIAAVNIHQIKCCGHATASRGHLLVHAHKPSPKSVTGACVERYDKGLWRRRKLLSM